MWEVLESARGAFVPRARAKRDAVPLLHGLEGLRFIASAGVASIHMLDHTAIKTPRLFTLFVDLFFVISGIVIGSLYVGRIQSWADYGTFMRRRLARIYPLHLATLLFYVVLGSGLAAYGLETSDSQRFATSQIIPNLLLVQAWFPGGHLSFNIVSWSISAEFFLYLSFPLIARALCGNCGLVIVALAQFAAVGISEGYLHEPLYLLTYNAAPLRAVPSFALGVVLSSVGRSTAEAIGRRLIRPACSVLLAAIALGMALDINGYVVLGLVYALVAATYFADLAGMATVMAWTPISKRGYLTYSIYMLHVPVTTVFISFIFPKLFGTSLMGQFVSVAAAVTILAVLARASFQYFEDPLRRLIR